MSGEDVPPPQRFRVTVGGSVMYRGNRVRIHVGKVIDSRFYDLDALRTQGIRMETVAE